MRWASKTESLLRIVSRRGIIKMASARWMAFKRLAVWLEECFRAVSDVAFSIAAQPKGKRISDAEFEDIFSAFCKKKK